MIIMDINELIEKVDVIVGEYFYDGYNVCENDDETAVILTIYWYDDGYECNKDSVTGDAIDALWALKEAGLTVGELEEPLYYGNDYYEVRISE